MTPAIFISAAYGGEGWQPRQTHTRDELGAIWAACGQDSEWKPLKGVLLHRPGPEILLADEPNAVQMLAPVDLARLQAQHDALAQAYCDAGVSVFYVEPDETPPPNLMFVADLLFMTPEGAILARPASRVRAGEERFIARRRESAPGVRAQCRHPGPASGAHARGQPHYPALFPRPWHRMHHRGGG